MPFTYPHPRPALTVDVGVVVPGSAGLEVLLIRRRHEPFRGAWALPGGYVDPDEDLAVAAKRELREETGVKATRLTQLGAYGAPGRDPRGHTVTVAWLALMPARPRVEAADDAEAADWFPLRKPPRLAFDHEDILRDAREWLRREVSARPLVFDLLPGEFTLLQLRQVTEAVLGEPLAPAEERRVARPWVQPVAGSDRYRFVRPQWRPTLT